MKLKDWFENVDTESTTTKAGLTVAGLVAFKLVVDYVKNYRDGRRILNFYSKYPEPFKGSKLKTL